MSLMNLLNVGKSALFASQTALNVTGHNIANVNTSGYTRQEVVLEIATPAANSSGYIGRGVSIAAVKRSYARFVEGQLLGQRQNLGRSTALNEVLSQVEQVFNDAAGVGLSESIEAFFGSWQSLTSSPDDAAKRTVLLSDAESLVSAAKQMEQDLLDTIGEIDDEIADIAGEVNRLADGIARLNEQIVRVEAGDSGTSANDLRDARGALVTELADLVQLSTREDEDGSLTVVVGMRNLVDGTRVNGMTASADPSGAVRLEIDGVDVAPRIGKGRVSGLLDARTAIESGPLKGLRRLAAALTVEINALHRGGYGLDGSTGNDFFSPLTLSSTDASAGADVTAASITDPGALTLSEYDVTIGAGGAYTVKNRDTGATVATGTFSSGSPIAFDGISVTLTGTVAAGDSFSVSPLAGAVSNFGVSISDTDEIAAADAASSLPGDNRNALRIAALADAGVSTLGNATVSGYYAGLVTSVGSMAADASDLQTFDANLHTELANQRDSASGVSLDEEATSLIVYQRAFEAAARLISVTDELLQTVLSL
ncbi:MAG: flagellar hook-associated protein FlgK [Thermodesulfobacteriota bacterium]